jgi:hypothetical protein
LVSLDLRIEKVIFVERLSNVRRFKIMGEAKGLGTREKIAAVVSAAILLTFVVYWIIQIDGVMDMLKLANG